MHWKHAWWAMLLVPCVAVERGLHRLWGLAERVRTFVWRRLTDCSCIKPNTSCSWKIDVKRSKRALRRSLVVRGEVGDVPKDS